jgi:uncharacterized protein (DUF433 family)
LQNRSAIPFNTGRVLLRIRAQSGSGFDKIVSMTLKGLKGVVHSDTEIMGGTPVFAGTRVPLQNLINYLEGGESIEDFLDGFPSVKREQVIAVIEAAAESQLLKSLDEAIHDINRGKGTSLDSARMLIRVWTEK